MKTSSMALVFVSALAVGFAQSAQAQQPSPTQQQSSPQQPSAQQQPPPAAAPGQIVTSAEVTDQEVEQFARSYQVVTQIQKDTESQLQGIQDPAGATKVKQQANQKMAEAVQAQGMKVERFNLIARSLNADATLKQRIQEKIQALRQPA